MKRLAGKFFISGKEKSVIILTALTMEEKFGNREYCNETPSSLYVNGDDIDFYRQKCGIDMASNDIARCFCSFYRQAVLKKKGII